MRTVVALACLALASCGSSPPRPTPGVSPSSTGPLTDPTKLAAIKASVLGIFGTRDSGIPTAKVDEFRATLTQAGVRSEIVSYDAEHAFANPSNPKYDETSASAAWTKVLAFLASL